MSQAGELMQLLIRIIVFSSVCLLNIVALAGGEGLTRKQIQDTVMASMSSALGCYESGLEKSPHIAGKVEVKFNISKSGRVSSVSILKSELKNMKVEACLVSELLKWEFPQPTGSVSVSVTYPFNFKKTSPAAQRVNHEK